MEFSQYQDVDKTLDAVWCVDSETGRQVLIDRQTNEIIAEKLPNGELKEPK